MCQIAAHVHGLTTEVATQILVRVLTMKIIRVAVVEQCARVAHAVLQVEAPEAAAEVLLVLHQVADADK